MKKYATAYKQEDLIVSDDSMNEEEYIQNMYIKTETLAALPGVE